MKNLPLAAALLAIALLKTAAGQGPTIRVVNAGSLLTDNLSPGTVILIKGTDLTDIFAQSPDQATPFSVLNGVSVKIGTTPVALLYVSPTQIQGVIDPSTPVGQSTLTVVTPVKNVSASVNIQQVAAPALLAASGSGGREGLFLNAVTYANGPFSVTTDGAPTFLALFMTSLDLSTAPTVTIGGLPAAVQSYDAAACCVGLERVDVQVPAALAGAGRVDVIVTSGGRTSNAVEIVVLPNVGQGPFSPAKENTPRNREIGAIAYVRALGIALVVDEKDDVIRVIDMRQRAVTRTIALASGSQPFAIAVNDAGTQAVVAERGRAKAAVIDLGRGVVTNEIPVGGGPSAVAINGDVVLVANQDDDTVSVISLVLKQLLGTIPVGRSPRALAIDDSTSLAYVGNQNSGTVSVVDIARRAVVDTLALSSGARPQNVRLIPPGGMLAVTAPNMGVLDLFDLTSKARFPARMTANDVAFQRSTAYLTNQTGTAAQAVPFSVGAGGISLGIPTAIGLETGVRAAAVDALDNLLLVSSEASGMVWLIDLISNRAAGSINAVRAEGESVARDDRSDRDRAANAPVVRTLIPGQAAAGTTVQLTVSGSNVGGTFEAYFTGPGGVRDTAFNIVEMDVDPSGNQVRLTVQIGAGATKGDHLLRLLTPNGENNLSAGSGNVLNIP